MFDCRTICPCSWQVCRLARVAEGYDADEDGELETAEIDPEYTYAFNQPVGRTLDANGDGEAETTTAYLHQGDIWRLAPFSLLTFPSPFPFPKCVTFQLAEVAVPRQLFAVIPERISSRLAMPPPSVVG